MNRYNSDIHHRRSIRLKGHDYARPGCYFVTACVQGRKCLFGEIINGRIQANECGSVVQAEWIKTAEMRRGIVLGEFVIMPNHFHGILRIVDPVGATCGSPLTRIMNDRQVGNRQVGNRQVGDRQVGDRQVAPTGPKRNSVGAVMAGFKSAVTKRINTLRDTPGIPVWQRNYFEHIIRNDTDYNQIAEYIVTNPRRWKEDKLHPDNPPFPPRRGDLRVAHLPVALLSF